MINLHCPTKLSHMAVNSPFSLWADVPEWWECTCGEYHYKTDPFKKRCSETRAKARCEFVHGHQGPHLATLDEISELMWS